MCALLLFLPGPVSKKKKKLNQSVKPKKCAFDEGGHKVKNVHNLQLVCRKSPQCQRLNPPEGEPACQWSYAVQISPMIH